MLPIQRELYPYTGGTGLGGIYTNPLKVKRMDPSELNVGLSTTGTTTGGNSFAEGQDNFSTNFTQNTMLPSYLPYVSSAIGTAAAGGSQPEDYLGSAGGILGTALSKGNPVVGGLASLTGGAIGGAIKDMRADEAAYNLISNNPSMYHQVSTNPYVRPEDPTMGLALMKEAIGANDKYNLKAQKKYGELAADIWDQHEAALGRYKVNKYKGGAERFGSKLKEKRERTPSFTGSIYG